MAAPLPAQPLGPGRRRPGSSRSDAREVALWTVTALLVVAAVLLWWMGILSR